GLPRSNRPTIQISWGGEWPARDSQQGDVIVPHSTEEEAIKDDNGIQPRLRQLVIQEITCIGGTGFYGATVGRIQTNRRVQGTRAGNSDCSDNDPVPCCALKSPSIQK